MPSLTQLWESGQFDDLMQFVRQNSKFSAIFSLPIVFTAPFWGVSLLNFLAGSEFVTTSVLILTILLGYLALMIGTFFESILYLTKETKKILWINVFTALLNILLNIAFIPYWGILGAGFSTLITFFLQTVIFYRFAARHFTFDFGLIELLKICFCSLMFAVIINLLPNQTLTSLIVSCFLGGIVYSFLIYKIRVVSSKELRFLYDFFTNEFIKKISP